MQPNYTYLSEKLELKFPIIGFYDTPNAKAFNPVVEVGTCMFAYFKRIVKGTNVLLTHDKFGCPGAGKWLCGSKEKSKEHYVRFLCDEEGLKANRNLMSQWLDYNEPYIQQNDNLVIGSLNDSEYEYLRTVSFFVNPDQVSILLIGSQLNAVPGGTEPVIAPFGSGCMQLISLFKDLNVPQAIIGGTDMAMRRFLPPDVMIFTVTKPLFEQLCTLDDSSYLNKPFIERLKKAREY